MLGSRVIGTNVIDDAAKCAVVILANWLRRGLIESDLRWPVRGGDADDQREQLGKKLNAPIGYRLTGVSIVPTVKAY